MYSITKCIYLYYAIVLCEVSKYLVQYPLVVCAVPVWWRVSSAPLTTTRKNNTIKLNGRTSRCMLGTLTQYTRMILETNKHKHNL